MQPPAVGVKEGHDVDGHDLHVEHFGILEIIVPDLADDIAKEFGDASFDRLVDGVWGFMGCLCTNTDNSCGIVGDGNIVEGEVGGTYDFLLTWSASYLTTSVRIAVREWIPFNWRGRGEESFPGGEQVIVSQELLGNHCLLDQIHLLPDIA